MSLSKPQLLVANSKKRFRVLVTGRRFGKTILSIRELCRFAAKQNQEIWYVAPSYKMAKGTVWRDLKKKLRRHNKIRKVNEAELYIDLKTGSRITLKGADNPDSLRGNGLDFLVLDEFADISPEAFYEVLRPTLSDKLGHAMFIGTPKGTGNWAFDMFNYGKDKNKEQWESWTFTSEQGGMIDPAEIQEARELLDERTFNQEYNASFETTGNRVWYGFLREYNVREFATEANAIWNILKGTPKTIHVGMDFNIDPMSAVIFAQSGKTIHAIDEIEMNISNTDEMVEELKNRYPKQRIIVYPDPASRQRKTSAGGKTDLSILKNAGFTVKAPHSHNPIRDGVNAVNSKLCNSLGDRTFLVDPSCKKLIKCLERHNYKPGTTIPDKTTGYDHLADAMRYYIDYAFPVRRIIEEHHDERWGV